LHCFDATTWSFDDRPQKFDVTTWKHTGQAKTQRRALNGWDTD